MFVLFSPRKDIQCHVWPYFLKLANHQIRPHIKWSVNMVIAYGHFNLPQGFVWVCMGQNSKNSNFIIPETLVVSHIVTEIKGTLNCTVFLMEK